MTDADPSADARRNRLPRQTRRTEGHKTREGHNRSLGKVLPQDSSTNCVRRHRTGPKALQAIVVDEAALLQALARLAQSVWLCLNVAQYQLKSVAVQIA